MNWSNLRENRCPKCGKNLTFDLNIGFGLVFCKNLACSFKITPKKFNEIVNSPVRYKSEKHYRPRDEEPE